MAQIKLTAEQQQILDQLQTAEQLGGSAGFIKSLEPSTISAPVLSKTSTPWPTTPAKLTFGASPNLLSSTGTLTTGHPGEVGTPYTVLRVLGRVAPAQISGHLSYQSWENLKAAPVQFTIEAGDPSRPTTVIFSRDGLVLATFSSKGFLATFGGRSGTAVWKNAGTPPSLFTEEQEKTISALQDVEALGGSAGYIKSLTKPATSATDAKVQPSTAVKARAIKLDCTASFRGSGAPGIINAYLTAREQGKPIGGYWTDLKYYSDASIGSVVAEGTLTVDSIDQLLDGPADFRVQPIFIGSAIFFSRGNSGSNEIATFFPKSTDIPLPSGSGTSQWRPGIAPQV